jgi:hypothetical protein
MPPHSGFGRGAGRYLDAGGVSKGGYLSRLGQNKPGLRRQVATAVSPCPDSLRNYPPPPRRRCGAPHPRSLRNPVEEVIS